jgi:hypothetical protein
MECGRLLSEAKEQIEHGEWLAWLEDNFNGSSATAERWMRLHEHRDEIESVVVALKLIARPKTRSKSKPDDEGHDSKPIDTASPKSRLSPRAREGWDVLVAADDLIEALKKILATWPSDHAVFATELRNFAKRIGAPKE